MARSKQQIANREKAHMFVGDDGHCHFCGLDEWCHNPYWASKPLNAKDGIDAAILDWRMSTIPRDIAARY